MIFLHEFPAVFPPVSTDIATATSLMMNASLPLVLVAGAICNILISFSVYEHKEANLKAWWVKFPTSFVSLNFKRKQQY